MPRRTYLRLLRWSIILRYWQPWGLWNYVSDHPKFAGLIAFISLAVTFSPKASVTATWVCLFLAWVLAAAMIYGTTIIRASRHPGVYTATLTLVLGYLFIPFGQWLTASKKDPQIKSIPQQTELSKKDLREAIDEALSTFSSLWKSEPAKEPKQSVPFEPVLHLEPEHGIIWSTGQNQTVGIFLFSLQNTGLEDIDNITVAQDYFVAQKGTDMTIKNLGGVPIVNRMPTILRSKDSAPVRVDFTKQIEIMNEVAANFGGPSLRGVKITISFRRHADGKEFTITRGYAVIGPHAEGLYTEGSEMDSMSRQLRNQFVVLSEVTPYFHSRDHWTPVTKEISSSPDGRLTIRHY